MIIKIIKVNNRITDGYQYHAVIREYDDHFIVDGGRNDPERALYEFNFNRENNLSHCNYRIEKSDIIE